MVSWTAAVRALSALLGLIFARCLSEPMNRVLGGEAPPTKSLSLKNGGGGQSVANAGVDPLAPGARRHLGWRHGD